MLPGDTIAAISSAVGPAARMIVRLSGPDAAPIASDFLEEPLPPPAHAAAGRLRLRGVSAPVQVYRFATPRSATGEDVIEFHIPGNVLLARMLLDEFIRGGARAAEPGEFTARAYFNGRIDLTEAEGVAATIAAQNESQLHAARRLMSGELARRLTPIMDELAQTLALIEAGIDFSDEDVSFLPHSEAQRRIDQVAGQLRELLTTSHRFESLPTQPSIVLVGRANAGKSTLLNALARTHRAVVSPIAGTTRDALSAQVELPRGIVTLHDVAGIEPDASSSDAIERQMRAAALRTLEGADFVILVIDATDDRPRLTLTRGADLVVRTKADLIDNQIPSDELAVSAILDSELTTLRTALSDRVFGTWAGGDRLTLNSRHVEALEEARTALDRARSAIGAGDELLALGLREALDALGGVLGQITPDDIVGRIFSRFCIGK